MERGKESHPPRSHAKRRAPARARHTNMKGEEQPPGGMAWGGAGGETGWMHAVLPMGRPLRTRGGGKWRRRISSGLQLCREIPELEHIVSCTGSATQHPAGNSALWNPRALCNLDLGQARLKQRLDDLGRSAHAAIMHFCVITQSIFALRIAA